MTFDLGLPRGGHPARHGVGLRQVGKGRPLHPAIPAPPPSGFAQSQSKLTSLLALFCPTPGRVAVIFPVPELAGTGRGSGAARLRGGIRLGLMRW